MTDPRDDSKTSGAQAQHQQVKESMARVVNDVLAERGGLDHMVRNYWWMLAALVAFAVAWGYSTMQLTSVADGVKTSVAESKATNKKLDEIAEAVAGMKVTSSRNRDDIANLQSRVWTLETRR